MAVETHLRVLARSAECKHRVLAAKDPALPAATTHALGGDPSQLVRTAIAERADLTAADAVILAADEHPLVRAQVASREDISEALLRTLLADPDGLVRLHAAANRAVWVMPAPVLEALCADPDPNVRVQVTDIAPIETLIDDPNPSVRCGIAERRDLTPDQLHQLATDTQFRVRRCVASNMSTPTELLEVLAFDPNEYVVSAVSWTRRVSVDAFRPSWLLAKFAATYKKLARRSANPDLFAELATSWTGSTKALLLAIADTCELLV